jgi:hypothetical protein
MKTRRTKRAPAAPLPKPIRCPYCDAGPFPIDYPTANIFLPTEPIVALPYARDVDIFDPDTTGRTNSEWTKIGKDFFGVLNYESIGILHMEKGWDVRYCVARCPECDKLIDVFANCTKGVRLSEMWPHLLAKDLDGRIKPWRPASTLNRLAEDHFFVLLFFVLVYMGSLTPHIIPYFRQPVFDADRFVAQTAPVCLIRGIVLIALIVLLSVRKRLIGLFRDVPALSALFDICTGLTYWSNFAVSRFTGYQKEGRGAPNAIMG